MTVAHEAELVDAWRRLRREGGRRLRAWPAEVRHDALMDQYLVVLEKCRRRGTAPHDADPVHAGRKAFRTLTAPLRDGTGYHARPRAGLLVEPTGRSRNDDGAAIRINPSSWIAECAPASRADMPDVGEPLPDGWRGDLEALRRMGWTWDEVAVGLRVSAKSLMRWLRGENAPVPANVAAIAELLRRAMLVLE